MSRAITPQLATLAQATRGAYLAASTTVDDRMWEQLEDQEQAAWLSAALAAQAIGRVRSAATPGIEP